MTLSPLETAPHPLPNAHLLFKLLDALLLAVPCCVECLL